MKNIMRLFKRPKFTIGFFIFITSILFSFTQYFLVPIFGFAIIIIWLVEWGFKKEI